MTNFLVDLRVAANLAACSLTTRLRGDDEAHMKDLGDTPMHVVAIWLIANSIFMRQQGSCRFSNIRVHQNEDTTVVP
jgi:hypothetical protein